jgi:hypothetical protein
VQGSGLVGCVLEGGKLVVVDLVKGERTEVELEGVQAVVGVKDELIYGLGEEVRRVRGQGALEGEAVMRVGGRVEEVGVDEKGRIWAMREDRVIVGEVEWESEGEERREGEEMQVEEGKEVKVTGKKEERRVGAVVGVVGLRRAGEKAVGKVGCRL